MEPPGPRVGHFKFRPPAQKHRGPPKRKALRNHEAHLCATSDFVPRFEALGNAKMVGVFSQQVHLWATSLFYFDVKTLETAWFM